MKFVVEGDTAKFLRYQGKFIPKETFPQYYKVNQGNHDSYESTGLTRIYFDVIMDKQLDLFKLADKLGDCDYYRDGVRRQGFMSCNSARRIAGVWYYEFCFYGKVLTNNLSCDKKKP